MTTNNTINAPTPISVANGGSGDASFTAYSVLCGGTTSGGNLQNVSGVGTSGQILLSNGASTLPTWQNTGLGSGIVLQCISTTKTSTFSTTSSTFTAITGLSVSITPASSSNQILVMFHVQGGNSGGNGGGFVKLLRGATTICVGNSHGTNIQATSGTSYYSTSPTTASMIYLDSPASTSSLTYSLDATVGGGGGTFYINETSTSTGTSYGAYASTITVWEISG